MTLRDRNVVRQKVEALRQGRVRYAQEFLRAKALQPGITDKHAMFTADDVTQCELVTLEAEVTMALKGNLY